jgi:sec-independent protein translocase protein TatB
MSADMIFILFLALILFGPKKLPEIGRQIGKFMADFKRASSDFQNQLTNEIEKAGVDVTPFSQGGGQQSSSLFGQSNVSTFAQTLLPPAVKSAISDIDTAHDRLMQTARLAFDAQNFTLRPPEAPVIAASTEPAEAALPLPSETKVAQSNAPAALPESSPVEAVTDQPTHVPAPASNDSAQQSS